MSLTLVKVTLADGQELNYIVESSSYFQSAITCINYINRYNPNAILKSIEFPGSLFLPKVNNGEEL